MTTSIVIPCWNAERFVGRAIQSALAQEAPNVEVIVVDDGSTDGSLNVIRSFGDRIIWRSCQNAGACAARNTGLAIAHGEYTLFLDADDLLSSDYVQNLRAAALPSDADLVIGKRRTNDGYVAPFFLNSLPLQIARAVLSGQMLQTSQMFWKVDFLRTIGAWDEKVERWQDVELAIRAMLARPRLAWSDQGHCEWTDNDNKDRVSKRVGPKQLLSDARWPRKFHDQIVKSNDEQLISALGGHYYWVATLCFENGNPALGREMLACRRSLGLPEHIGSHAHILGAKLLGLHRKTVLSRWMRQRRDQLAALLRPDAKGRS